ncbi:PIN domain-containing protein [Romboutsia sp. 1001713B170207_170306_H8]|uniref:PIN domain-containing protein n=1 Tax=Romboutsia sp. 1001713B170207_170306_H8 TaxID=2787112 RepID=UPI0018984B45|nr:PIN domain-containing protein [Romboutsia sp. 1001713B170207_170306_H8]
MEKFFLIDTENVNMRALYGAHLLNPNDLIILFTTNRTSTTSFKDSVIDALNTSAKIKKINVTTGIKNSLDFQLVGYLGYLIGSNKDNINYYIVSKDKGYLSSINLLSEISNTQNFTIDLIPSIQSISYDLYNEAKDPMLDLEDEIIVELKGYGYTNKTITKALIVIQSSFDLESLELNFFLQFGWNKKILNICKPIVHQYYSNSIA